MFRVQHSSHAACPLRTAAVGPIPRPCARPATRLGGVQRPSLQPSQEGQSRLLASGQQCPARCRANASPAEPAGEPFVSAAEDAVERRGGGAQPWLWASAVALLAAAAYAATQADTLTPYLKERLSASRLQNSSLFAAFSLIFLSEIGDKTFFLAGLLAAKLGRVVSFTGSMCSLSFMTLVSVGIGFAFKSVPDTVKSSVPVGQILGTLMMLYFGFTTLRSSFSSPQGAAAGAGAREGEEEEGEELKEAERSLRAAESGGSFRGGESLWGGLSAVAALIFVAEWGDRSMMATIALGASQSPAGVAIGAILGHGVATAIAVICGALAAQYISERMISRISGVLYLFFAAATALGYM